MLVRALFRVTVHSAVLKADIASYTQDSVTPSPVAIGTAQRSTLTYICLSYVMPNTVSVVHDCLINIYIY
jgi:hypothetical protein